MSDPIWNKVYELTKDYPPEFNAAAIAKLIEDAWRMGFNVVRDQTAPTQLMEALNERARQYRQAKLG